MHTCFLTPSCSKSPYVMLNFRRVRAGILPIYFLDLFGSFSCWFLKSSVLIMTLQLLNQSLFNSTLTVIDFVNIQTKKIWMLTLLVRVVLDWEIHCLCWTVLMLFTECWNFTPFRSYGRILGGTLDTFLAVNIQILISTPLNFVLIFISMRYVKSRVRSRAEK